MACSWNRVLVRDFGLKAIMKREPVIIGFLILQLFNFPTFQLSTTQAQQLPLFSQYMHNALLYNPAVSGTNDYLPASLTYRSQWSGLKDAPVTQVISIHGPANGKVGLGAAVLNDKAGPFGQTMALLAYSYRLKLCNGHHLSFGLAPVFYQFSVNKNKLTTDTGGDPVMEAANEKAISADFNAGLLFYSERYYAGLAATQLGGNRIYFGEKSLQAALGRHFLLSAGYRYEAGATWMLEPAGLLKFTPGAPLQGDLGLKAVWKRLLMGGITARASTSRYHKEAVTAFAGIRQGHLHIVYAYDYILSSLGGRTASSHEVRITWRIPVTGSRAAGSVPQSP